MFRLFRRRLGLAPRTAGLHPTRRVFLYGSPDDTVVTRTVCKVGDWAAIPVSSRAELDVGTRWHCLRICARPGGTIQGTCQAAAALDFCHKHCLHGSVRSHDFCSSFGYCSPLFVPLSKNYTQQPVFGGCSAGNRPRHRGLSFHFANEGLRVAKEECRHAPHIWLFPVARRQQIARVRRRRRPRSDSHRSASSRSRSS
jgi:hypothetical protein